MKKYIIFLKVTPHYVINMLLEVCINYLNILTTLNEKTRNYNVVDLVESYNLLQILYPSDLV